MSTGSIRRAQLISPFGVGAMSILVDGTSVITAGLDHWYDSESNLALEEYREQDWRLAERLKVREFRLPPDYRIRSDGNGDRNIELTVPVLRFPRWSFCIYCKRLKLSTLTLQQPEYCPDAKHQEGKTTEDRQARHGPRMSQVPFVAICAHGHLDDFPFVEWVHRSHRPECEGALRLFSRGGGGLDGQVVTCDSCKLQRTLRGITEASHRSDGTETTVLSNQLAGPHAPYLCQGARPWLATFEGDCGAPIRGALRGAGNIYFPNVESSIYLPRKVGAVKSELHDLVRRPEVGPVMKVMHSAFGDAVTAEGIRAEIPPELLSNVSDEDLMAAYFDYVGAGAASEEAHESLASELLTGDDVWRYPEYQLLRECPQDDYLTARDPGIDPTLTNYLGRVRSVDVLRETRALRGFTRVRDDVLKLSEGKALLRRTPLTPSQDWLPAYVVKGEGIYFELGENRLAEWENTAQVRARAQLMTDHYRDSPRSMGRSDRNVSSRLVLLHTLAHLLINELIFACGYGSASLRERLYVSESSSYRMNGLLIYTAAGDSEGTMGGLVRMSRPGNFRSVFVSAVSSARWCSTDPVCMDAGERGQGPDSCNLAACHGCALLPETSCEHFNRFLDRGMVIGTFSEPSLGYFSDLAI